jgi:hypothetical protein
MTTYAISMEEPELREGRPLGADDFGKIIASSKLFARKFDVTQDAEILT